MITGDLHGNRKNLDILLSTAQLEKYPNRHIIFQEVIHTRNIAIDHRDLSFLEILDILKYVIQFPDRVHILLGNHDFNFFVGKEMVHSKRKLNYRFRRGVKLLFEDKSKKIIDLYKKIILIMPAMIQSGKILLTHSNFDEGYENYTLSDLTKTTPFEENSPLYKLITGRVHSKKAIQPLLEQSNADFSIIGHEICQMGYDIPNAKQIIIDSCHKHGCYILCQPNTIKTIKDLKKHIKKIRKERYEL